MPDVNATQRTPVLRSHAPMLVNNAVNQPILCFRPSHPSFSSALLKRLWPCLFLWHFSSSSLPVLLQAQLALWHSSDQSTSPWELLYLAPQLVAQKSVQCRFLRVLSFLSKFGFSSLCLSLLLGQLLCRKLLGLSLCFWNVRLTFWFRVEPLLLLFHRGFDGSRLWFRTGLNGFLLLFNDIPSSDHVQFIADSLLSILLSLVAAIWFDEFFGVFFGKDFGCVFVASDMSNIAQPFVPAENTGGFGSGDSAKACAIALTSGTSSITFSTTFADSCVESAAALEGPVSSLDRLVVLVVLVEEWFVSLSTFQLSFPLEGLFLFLFLFLCIFLVVTFFCRDVKLLLICVVRLVGFLVLLRHVYCLSTGSCWQCSRCGHRWLGCADSVLQGRWLEMVVVKLATFVVLWLLWHSGEVLSDFAFASRFCICGCVTAGGVGTRSVATATCGEFGESEGEGVSKTRPSDSKCTIPVAFRCAACLVLLMLMTMMKQRLLQDWDSHRWSSDAAPWSSSWCWQGQIAHPSVVLLTALSEGSRLPALVALLPFETLKGRGLLASHLPGPVVFLCLRRCCN
ncbi:hypothetical protein KCU69_g8, partial [Aureobasidium melanogenum]